MKKIIVLVLALVTFSLFAPSKVFAVDSPYCNFSPGGVAGVTYGDVTLNETCVVYEDVNGVYNGNLTLTAGKYLTIHKKLIFAPSKQINIPTSSAVYINTGGTILQRVLCVKDADGDHYADVTLLTLDPNTQTTLLNDIYQISKIEADINGICPANFVTQDTIYNLTMADTDPATANSNFATADSELLRLGFTVSGIIDPAQAAVNDIQIIDKNLLVCNGGACPTTDFSSTYGNIYTEGKIGIGITNPTYPLDVTGNTRLTGTLNVSSTVTAPTFSGALSGNATTATTLQTPRTIWGQSFNGSAAISGALSGATTGSFSSTVTAPTFSGALSGNATTATTLIGDQSNWASYRTTAVANMLSWKNYGNGHIIFDASNSTSPTGSAVNNTNSQVAWTGSYPTLMGWNGTNTYGVRVDSARYADDGNICTLVAYTAGSGTVQCPAGFYTMSGTGLTAGQLLCCKVNNPI